MRLEQGWEYLKELGIERDKNALPRYLKWITSDIALEEKSAIEEQNINESLLNKEVVVISRGWYIRKILNGAS